jgi:serine kinase of HPr protein (carbohydrate metabolism regulator)
MQVKEIIEQLELTPCSGTRGLDREITGGYVSDLLSDVMGHAREGEAWITLQSHKNIMAIASLKELAAIILVKGRRPDDDTAAASDDEGIPVLSTPLSTFEASGRLHRLLVAARREKPLP